MPLENQNENTKSQDRQNGGSQDSGTQDQKPSAKDGTLAEHAGLDTKTVWPETWRESAAGGDEKKLAQLKRFASPDKWADSHFSLVQRIATGEFRSNAPKPTGDDVKPEAVKAWKTERGLPADIADIKVPLPAGAKMEDLDEGAKARIGHFTKAFFDGDLTQAQVDHVMTQYNEYAEKEARDMAVADATQRDGLEDSLRADWGAEFRTNIQMTDRFMQKTFGEEGADDIMGARTADGRRLFNIPGVFKALTELARQAGVDDNEGGESQVGGKSVDARIKEINEILVSDRARYRRENLDVEKQALLERKEARGR